MTAPSAQREELRRLVEAELASSRERRARQLAELPRPALEWLALAPLWTIDVAVAAGFPDGADRAGLNALLAGLAGIGLCTVGDVGDPVPMDLPGSTTFWMPDEHRPPVLSPAVQDAGRGLAHLRAEARRAAAGVLTAAESGLAPPGLLERWATLAAEPDVSSMAALLNSRCDDLLAAGDSGDVVRWIEAARPLENLVRGELTAAVDRVRKRLELFHRRDDERHLRRFLERPDLIAAFNELLDGDDAHWALHYAGAGGTGKTMLMRYIQARLIPARRASSSRIDFDYLNPDYPAKAPGLLLAELSEELRLHDDPTGEATSLFGSFDEQVLRLHERLSGRFTDAVSAPGLVGSDDFVRMLDLFADAAARLPQPVVLLLDTCEELSKVRPDGSVPDGVRATFDLLVGLHDRLPTIRVVFGGRRPLASAGDMREDGPRWISPSSDEQPVRPYLRLQEVRGFQRPEAERFLKQTLGVSPELVGQILIESADPGDAMVFHYHFGDPTASEGRRYSPYDLAAWGRLAARDPEGTADALRSSDGDRYVELRIVRRITNEAVRRVLPAVAALGLFDRTILEVAAGATAGPDGEITPGSAVANDIFIELVRQEWVERRGSVFFGVDKGLARRLLRAFRGSDPEAVQLARERVADHLERVTLGENLSDLTVLHFDLALRLLADDPARAASWWVQVERRFAVKEPFEWARSLTEYLLGADGAAHQAGPPTRDAGGPAAFLDQAILATQAAAWTHCRPAIPIETWPLVLQRLNEHPLTDERERLRIRALAGSVATKAVTGGDARVEVDSLARALETFPVLDDQLAASVVAAAEAVLEAAERVSTPHRVVALSAVLAPKRFGNEGVRLFRDLLDARLRVLLGHRQEAAEIFRAAVDSLGTAPIESRWLDWLAPRNVWHRVGLEFGRAAVQGLFPPEEGLRAITRALELTDERDAVEPDYLRLQSALLTLVSRHHGPGDTAVVPSRLKELTLRDLDDRATRNAHAAFPPLPVAAAEALAALGHVDEAVEALQGTASAAEASAVSLDLVDASERALLRIGRRMRLADEQLISLSALANSPLLADRALVWTIAALRGPGEEPWSTYDPPDATTDPVLWRHERWRTAYTLEPREARQRLAEISREGRGSDADASSTFAAVSAHYDAVEANLLAVELEEPPLFEANTLVRPAEWWANHRDRPEQAVVLFLRAAALSEPPERPALPDGLRALVGSRRVAELALEDGELLALRLPGRAYPLLEEAAEGFARCGDHVGALIGHIAVSLVLGRLGLNFQAFNRLARIGKRELELVGELPTLETLQKLASRPAVNGLDTVAPLGWRPWLVRYVAVRSWAAGRGGPRRARQLLPWLERNYGYVLHLEKRLPVELHGWLTEPHTENIWRRMQSPADVNSPLRDAWQRVRARRQGGRWVGDAVRVTATVLGIVGSLLLIAWRWGWVMFAGYFVVSGGLLVMLQRRSRKRYAYVARSKRRTPRRGPPIVRAEVSGGEEDASFTLTLDDGRKSTHVDIRLRPSLAAGYGQAVGTPVLPARAPVALTIPLEATAWPWEALLSASSVPPWSAAPHIFRTVPRRSIGPGWPAGGIDSAVSLIGGLHDESIAAEGWLPFTQSRSAVHMVVNALGATRTVTPTPQLLHLVAQPSRTATGARLLFHGSERARAKSATRSEAPRGQVLQARDLTSLFPDLAVCVVQAPVETRWVRTDAERWEAANLRLVAGELHQLGVPLVVTIPNLPPELATAVLSDLATVLASVKTDPGVAVAAALAVSRKMVGEAREGDDVARRESAYDICLYWAG